MPLAMAAAAQFGHELSAANVADGVEFGGHAAAEAIGRLGGQLLLHGGAADVDEVEGSRLQQHITRLRRDLGFLAAHDAADAHRPGAVADHERVGVEGAQFAVEGAELVALGGPAHDDRHLVVAHSTGAGQQLVIIEGVQGFAPLEHDIVGDVHQIADRALAYQLQASLHPERRWLHRDVADNGGREAIAEVVVFDLDIAIVAGGRILRLPGGHGRVQKGAGDRRHLAGDADDGGDADHVGRDRDVKDHIAQVVGQRHAHGGIGRQDEDAFVLIRQAQLLL